MTAKYFNFVDGQRLPGARVKEFLMNQAVIQCENQTEITGSGIENLGARVAINLEDGQLWTYTPDIEAWAPAQNTLDLDLLDARYYTKIAADGVFISETTADARYLTEVTARGIFLSTSDADTKYYTKLQADGLFLSETTADSKYYTKLQADGLFLTQTSGDTRYYTKLQADGLFLTTTSADTRYYTKVTADGLFISQTTADGRYITQATAGNLFISKGGAAGDINGNSTTIDGGKITTNTINVNRLVAGTLTGFRIQTSSSGQRVVMSESTNSLVFFNSSSEVGRLQGLSNMSYETPSNHAFSVDGVGTVFSINSSGVALAPGRSFNSTLGVNGDVNSSGILRSSGVTIGNSVTANGAVSAGSSVSAGTTVESGSTVIVGVMNTTTLAANVRHSSNASALIRFTSDARIKDDIEPIDTGLEIINQLNPVTFDSLVDDDERRVPGFIAQEVEEVFPEDIFMVTQVPGLAPENLEIPDIEENPLRSLEPTHFIPYLVKAVQELSAKNDALEARLAALEGGAQ